ncbi:MAG: type II secretion system protein [Deltaproteobacteria bacterium]|nr:type II secretion system protein [Deltaproteobacteria bacterium]
MTAPEPESAGQGRGDGAFTLLEVMIALAILALGLTVIGQAQQVASRQVLRSKMMTTATLLARHKMVDVEDELFKEGFDGFDETQDGDFDDQGFPRYGWELKVEKIELPENVDGESIGEAAGDASGQGGSQSGMSKLGGNMLGQQFKIFRGVLEESIRRVSLRVFWQEGVTKREIPLVAYFTDPRKVDVVAGALSAFTSGGKAPKSGEMGGQPRLPGTAPGQNPVRGGTPTIRAPAPAPTRR